MWRWVSARHLHRGAGTTTVDLQGTLWAAAAQPHAECSLPRPTVPPPAWLHPTLPLGALRLVSDRPGRAGSWWLPAGEGPGLPGLPGPQRPGPAAR